MWDFVVAHWCFAPYLVCLGILALMSVRERTGEDRDAAEGESVAGAQRRLAAVGVVRREDAVSTRSRECVRPG